MIADAKYKPIDNIGNKDYLQVLAYMFRFDAKKGFYFYPEMGEEEDAVMWLNRGSTYEKNVEAREDICLIKHGFQIPTEIDVYSAFIYLLTMHPLGLENSKGDNHFSAFYDRRFL